MVDVSVVVPFFNPAANLDDCVDSLRDQTLDRRRFEVILVDDGSTDGSDRRAQRFVDADPDLVRLVRIPASGWPGRPRNVGVDLAQGSYVQFVDSDDTLHPEALERLLQVALESDADIVVGKLSSDFRGLNHPVFRRTVIKRTVFDYPLVETLTPHKMVRRALLVDHRIRFAEGPRHVEDEHFSMQIYTHAVSVAVVGDLPCYFYRRRRVAGRNLGDTEAVPAEYYRDLAAVLDVIDNNVDDADARIPLQRRFYRNELLGRLRGRQMAAYEPAFRRDVFDQVRTLALTRFAPEVRNGLGCFVRTQSSFVVNDDLDGLTAFAAWLATISLRATARAVTWQDGRLDIDIAATLYAGDRPLHLDRDGDDWVIPAQVASRVSRQDRVVTADDLANADLDCATISRADSQLWSTTDGLQLSMADDGSVHIIGTARIDPATLGGGRALPPGLWDLRLRVMFGGLTTTTSLAPAGHPEQITCRLLNVGGEPVAIQPYWTSPTPVLALDIGEWSHPLTDLLDVDTEPLVSRGRLRLAASAISGSSAGVPAQVLFVSADPAVPTIRVNSTMTAQPTGATVAAKLPRALGDGPWQVWARIGEPGAAAARRLPWAISRSGRRLRVTADPH